MNHNDVIKKFELVKLLAALRLRHFQYPYERSSKVGGEACGMLWVSVFRLTRSLWILWISRQGDLESAEKWFRTASDWSESEKLPQGVKQSNKIEWGMFRFHGGDPRSGDLQYVAWWQGFYGTSNLDKCSSARLMSAAARAGDLASAESWFEKVAWWSEMLAEHDKYL